MSVLLRVTTLFKRMGMKAVLTAAAKCLYYITEYPVMQLMELIPLKVKENRILFASNVGMSDNAGVLYEAMLGKKKNLQYDIIWLVASTEQYKGKEPKHVTFIRERNMLSDSRSLRAYYYARTAEKVIFTHTMNWVKNRSPKQLYLNLWHGCGYKASKSGDEPIKFDYCLVPGKIFIETKSLFFQCSQDKLLPIGYPRYDVMLKESPVGERYIRQFRKDNDTKIIMWMPTYRKSTRAHLTENTLDNRTDIPLLDSAEEIQRLDEFCRKCHVVLVLKRHHLELDYVIKAELENIKIIDDSTLEDCHVRLYEILQYTDALLTDYSSIAVDYLLLDKPIGFILQDFEQYRKTRGFVFENPLDYMPGNHIYEMRQMREFIKGISNGEDSFASERQRVKQKMHTAVSSNYCEKVLELFHI